MSSKATATDRTKRTDLIAVGASTGGPGALVELLKGLPHNFPVPIVIAQHIEPAFMEGFIVWLNTLLKMRAVPALEGAILQAGFVYVVRTEGQLTVGADLRLHYDPTPSGQLYIPNIDLFFSALSRSDLNGMGILLTGMGEDGAKGLKSLAERGWRTFVQTPESCIVSGMPATAMRLSKRHLLGSPQQLAGFLRTEGLYRTGKPNG